MQKYELATENKINWMGRTLFRIRACRDFTTVTGEEIHKGDLGGYVEKESNLAQDGNAWVYGDAEVYGDASIFSSKHILCIAPIGDYASLMTAFRTKQLVIKISFEGGLYTINEFNKIINGWDDVKNQDVARAAIELAKLHIDLTPEDNKSLEENN